MLATAFLLLQAKAAQPVTPPTPRREVPDSGIIATDQRVTPAGVQSVFTGRVSGVRFGRDGSELIRLRLHEQAHVRQYEMWGPFFFLAYPASSLLQLLRGRSPYHHNHFEVQARAAAGAKTTSEASS